jgi:hypothetical protein
VRIGVVQRRNSGVTAEAKALALISVECLQASIRWHKIMPANSRYGGTGRGFHDGCGFGCPEEAKARKKRILGKLQPWRVRSILDTAGKALMNQHQWVHPP